MVTGNVGGETGGDETTGAGGDVVVVVVVIVGAELGMTRRNIDGSGFQDATSWVARGSFGLGEVVPASAGIDAVDMEKRMSAVRVR